MAKYRIHFNDNYGHAIVECLTDAEYNETYKKIKSNDCNEDIWTEYYDEEEGWQS